jgi:hypothetical protein
MTRLVWMSPDPLVLLTRFKECVTDSDLAEDRAAMLQAYEGFLDEFEEYGRAFTEMKAWCRLVIGLLQGEDVPISIHVPEGEDPADTARWQKWRLS